MRFWKEGSGCIKWTDPCLCLNGRESLYQQNYFITEWVNFLFSKFFLCLSLGPEGWKRDSGDGRGPETVRDGAAQLDEQPATGGHGQVQAHSPGTMNKATILNYSVKQ